jgi:hypothetical protein
MPVPLKTIPYNLPDWVRVGTKVRHRTAVWAADIEYAVVASIDNNFIRLDLHNHFDHLCGGLNLWWCDRGVVSPRNGWTFDDYAEWKPRRTAWAWLLEES